MSVYTKISYEEGSLFTVWGPCSGFKKDPCDCPQCTHAEDLVKRGLDYENEYEKFLRSE